MFFLLRGIGELALGRHKCRRAIQVLLYGGVTPFVLRRGSVFDVPVGDAYVYGAMKGELVEITAKQKDLDGIGPWKDEFFLLG